MGNPLAGALGEAWDLYRTHFKHLIPIAFIVYLVTGVITLLLTALLGSLGAIVSLILSIAGYYWLQGALVAAAEDIRDGRADLSIGETFSRTRNKIGPIFGAAVLAGIGITIGFVLLIVPGLILLTIWSMIIPVIVLEGAGVFDSFGRSQQLVKGYGWNVFGVAVLAFLILIAVGIVIGIIFMAVPVETRNFVQNIVSGTLIAPFVALVLTVVYFRLKEAKSRPASAPPGAPDRSL